MSFKICLIGCGSMSDSHHGPSVKRYVQLHKDSEFTACCDLDENKAKAYKEKYGAKRYYTDINTMLDTEKPNAVCLIAPVEKTADLSSQILAKGYPLILEKPPGQTIDETKRMIAAAGNIPNVVAFNRRYMPLTEKVSTIINEMGGTSQVMDITYRMQRANRFDPDFSTTAIHGVDLVRHVTRSNYKHINFRYNTLSQHGQTVANFHMSGVMENGIIVSLDFLPVSGIVAERMEINTVKGFIFVNLPFGGGHAGAGSLEYFVDNKLVLTLDGKELSSLEEAAWENVSSCEESSCTNDASSWDYEYVHTGFYHENAYFFDAIKSGNMPTGGLETCLQSVDVADCLRRRVKEYSK